MSYTHGYSGYTNYKCRCAVCRAGNTAAVKRRRAERRGSGLAAGQPHGSTSTYTNYGCRCQLCRDAWAANARVKRAQARGNTA